MIFAGVALWDRDRRRQVRRDLLVALVLVVLALGRTHRWFVPVPAAANQSIHARRQLPAGRDERGEVNFDTPRNCRNGTYS